MYRFNRFYLLFSLVFSYVIPFISIPVQLSKPENKPQIIFEEAAQQIILTQPEQETFDWTNMLWVLYGTITLVLLIRSILAIRSIKKIEGERLIYQNYNVIVTKENLSPFSFWNTIYLGTGYMNGNTIDPRIFLHEKSHLDQKHSTDLILMDILKVFTWFNPLLFLYKKAIVTNHEFLADEAVLKSRYNVKDYQNLILEEIINTQNLPFTHSFNFTNTKKRFIMMTTKKSKFIVFKKAVGITTLVAAAALFAQKTYTDNSAQFKDTQLSKSERPTGLSTSDPYQEFKDILSKYADLLNSGKYAEFSKKISDSDKKRLEELYPQLTDAQRNEQKVTFINVPDLKKQTPTEDELKLYLNKNNYAVWIDSKKIENNSLNNYKASDFARITVSGVSKNARTGKNPQPYQVSLMTHDYFKKIKDEQPHTAMGIKKESIKAIADTIPPKKTVSNEGKNTNTNTDKNFTDAEYPGGQLELRKKVVNTMDTSIFDFKKGTLKSTAYIHIDETGKITQVTATGDNEAFTNELLRTAKAISSEASWKPATKDGKAVATIYKLPATMTFQ
ncbi:hypothetical protein ACM46_04280 [Chryseobacterium angstadtii]|uniref:Peptidase M56 domain-containing protein n=2 Tax=Chryseobacterium angstadtii TaxID=558151 RepID=A0A0J7IKU4_9FLAO|nr:hypothetical protein ACM46_04280 [Chryseobacterium angstadtii]